MKDKLIQAILEAHNDQGTEALTIVDNLRCDKCKHWFQGRRTRGFCENEHNEVLNSPPGFFCALWEVKP